jgi:lipopolysaccharide export system permease protein
VRPPPPRPMGLLHRHLFFSVATACAVAVGLFAFILIAGIGLRDLLGYVVAGQLAPGTAARLVVLLLPYVAVHALPIGLLTAVLLVLGRLSSQHEITAMRAAGLGLGYIARPVWLIATLAAALALWLNFQTMPAARVAYRETLVAAVRQNPLNFIVPRTFIREFPGYVIYVGARDGAELRDFWLWQLDERQRVLSVARAARGTLDFRASDGVLLLTLREVGLEARDREQPEDFSRPQPVGNSDELAVELKFGGVFKNLNLKPKIGWMTLPQLRERRAALEARGASLSPAEQAELTRIKVTVQERAAGGLAVLAFTLIGVPLGIRVSRKETSANLGLAVALVLGYYFLTTLIGLLERAPALRPELWMWLPPLLYAAVGLVLFRRLDRA